MTSQKPHSCIQPYGSLVLKLCMGWFHIKYIKRVCCRQSRQVGGAPNKWTECLYWQDLSDVPDVCWYWAPVWARWQERSKASTKARAAASWTKIVEAEKTQHDTSILRHSVERTVLLPLHPIKLSMFHSTRSKSDILTKTAVSLQFVFCSYVCVGYIITCLWYFTSICNVMQNRCKHKLFT